MTEPVKPGSRSHPHEGQTHTALDDSKTHAPSAQRPAASAAARSAVRCMLWLGCLPAGLPPRRRSESGAWYLFILTFGIRDLAARNEDTSPSNPLNMEVQFKP